MDSINEAILTARKIEFLKRHALNKKSKADVKTDLKKKMSTLLKLQISLKYPKEKRWAKKDLDKLVNEIVDMNEKEAD